MLCLSSGKRYSVRVARCWREGSRWCVNKKFLTWVSTLPHLQQQMLLSALSDVLYPRMHTTLLPSGKFVSLGSSSLVLPKTQRFTWAILVDLDSDSQLTWSSGGASYTPAWDQFSRKFGSALAVARALMVAGDTLGAHEVAEAGGVPNKFIASYTAPVFKSPSEATSQV